MPSDRRLLVVHAHPDDEVINSGILMARYAAEGASVTLVTCTLGEEGEILVPELAHLAADRDDALGEYRIGELAAAMKALGWIPGSKSRLWSNRAAMRANARYGSGATRPLPVNVAPSRLPTITAPACVPASWGRNLGLFRKLMQPGLPGASEQTPPMTTLASPFNSRPKRVAISPRVCVVVADIVR